MEQKTDFEINVLDRCNIVEALSLQVKLMLGLAGRSNDEYFITKAREMNDTYYKFTGANTTFWDAYENEQNSFQIRVIK